MAESGGGIIVLFVSSYVGFQFATRCSARPIQIRQMISCLGSLKSYITYACLPLHEALMQCTHGASGPVPEFFHNVANLLEENGVLTPQQAMTKALSHMHGRLFLGKEENEVLHVLGGNLGVMNRKSRGIT